MITRHHAARPSISNRLSRQFLLSVSGPVPNHDLDVASCITQNRMGVCNLLYDCCCICTNHNCRFLFGDASCSHRNGATIGACSYAHKFWYHLLVLLLMTDH
jgi:hypothetical protein